MVKHEFVYIIHDGKYQRMYATTNDELAERAWRIHDPLIVNRIYEVIR